MWGDLIFLISPFIMPTFADNLTITFLTETFICKTSMNYKLFCLIIGSQLKPLMSYKIINYFYQLGNQNIEVILRNIT